MGFLMRSYGILLWGRFGVLWDVIGSYWVLWVLRGFCGFLRGFMGSLTPPFSFLPPRPQTPTPKAKLKDRDDPNQLLMDSKRTFPLLIPYNPTPVPLDSIRVPSYLNLDFLIPL